VVVAVACALCYLGVACDRDVTLIDPPDFFDFDRSNAWPECNVGGAPSPPAGSIPPPPGIRIEVCPNPASLTDGDRRMLFRFVPVVEQRINLAVFDDRGRLVREIVVDRNLQANVPQEFAWDLTGVSAGDYRAYFRAGSLESNSDLRVEP
jgi:hypothetical protein